MPTSKIKKRDICLMALAPDHPVIDADWQSDLHVFYIQTSFQSIETIRREQICIQPQLRVVQTRMFMDSMMPKSGNLSKMVQKRNILFMQPQSSTISVAIIKYFFYEIRCLIYYNYLYLSMTC